MNSFLDPDGFQEPWDGPALTSAQENILNLLLQVASNWIYARLPGIAGPVPGPADPTAQLVVFEVVSNVLRYGKYAPLSEYSRTTGHRMEGGSLSSEVQRYFTDDHKMLLGIPLRALPMTSCSRNDFDAADPDQGWPTRWSDRFGNLGWDYWEVSND